MLESVSDRKEKEMFFISEDGIITYDSDGDCTLCDNWGCEVCG